MILDWWLSPELYLRRPPAQYPEYRLDRLLKRKAEEGVKIYICVYKEVTQVRSNRLWLSAACRKRKLITLCLQTMSMSSSHTKHELEDMHENIAVMRHPDHLGGEQTLYWSHHEKMTIVDSTRATVGGLDLCFGRWDLHDHPLADVHPTHFDRTLFPGLSKPTREAYCL
jgi:phospholipase D1/2